ncbi:hypothetical protein GY205_000326 [Salmonella enterica]|nr:hypothetical protein [Salmonella enterica]
MSHWVKNGEKPAILTAAPFRGFPQPEAHYRSGFNGRPYEVRGCVVRFRVAFLLSFFCLTPCSTDAIGWLPDAYLCPAHIPSISHWEPH